MSIEAMKQALEALALIVAVEWTPAFTRKEYDSDEPEENEMRDRVLTAITALRTAIEQAEKQEPGPEEPAGHKSGGVQPPLQEPVACKHEWFRTGAMEPGECRCIRCGKWSSVTPPAAPVQEPESFEQWNAKQHGDPEEIGFLQALRIAYCAGQDSVTNTTPPAAQRQFVGLTDEEYAEAEKAVWAVVSLDDVEREANREFYQAIEAKLREKNGVQA